MRILITAGPTREPIDPVRFLGNRSSGRLGMALVTAAIQAGHQATLILGPVDLTPPPDVHIIPVETTAQMQAAVLREFPSHDVLIMAAAVADYRPKTVAVQKLGRSGSMTLELEATEDIVAAAAQSKRPDQKVIGFSLEAESDVARAREKLARKKLDMIVFNPLRTINSPTISASLMYRDGTQEDLPEQDKNAFAQTLIARICGH